MARLSQPIERLREHYEVVVIGSGYGGAIAASRMARAGCQVCLLERGREFALGDFPRSAFRGWREIQWNMTAGRWGRPLGLFEIHVNNDVNAVVGCGLGGTSLINAGVALKPDARVWDDRRWPRAIREDLSSVEAGFHHARQMLRPCELPASFGALRKLSALHASAMELEWADEYYRPPINVTFKDGLNHAGVKQGACTACGDCVSGCNHGAKNTTAMTYLPDAVNHGAAIFTQVEARSVRCAGDKWVLNYQLVDVGRELFSAPELSLSADLVIIAAGAIGSTTILQRSKQRGLPISENIGKRFTGNGDVLAFAYDADVTIDGIGFGDKAKGSAPDVGPCITGIIDHRKTHALRDGFVVEEGSLPGALGLILPSVLVGADALAGKSVHPWRDWLKARVRILKSLILGPYRGATRRTQTYLVMAHDDERGEITVEDDRPRISWPGAGSQPIFKTINHTLRRATKAIGGDFVENPIWSKSFARKLVTVHPLGGCPMGENANEAVVDHKGCVFSTAGGERIHRGLHVVDGAILPMSLGVNPLLTISALAERCCALIAKERGLSIDYASRRQAERSAEQIGLRFTERMSGNFSTARTADFSLLEARSWEVTCSRIEATLTIASEDLGAMLAGEAHEAAAIGTLTCSALADGPMTITGGRFNLFVRKPDDFRVRLMVYRGTMRAENGAVFHLHGVKVVAPGPPTRAWHDTTTLYTTIFGDREGEKIVGRGVLHIALGDFLRQLRTFEVTGAHSFRERLEGLVRFLKFFAGVLLIPTLADHNA